MKDELQKIFDDLKNLKYIESYAVIFIVIVILGLDIFGDSVEQTIMNNATLAVLSILVYVSIQERREYSSVKGRGEINGISVFNTSRDKLPPLRQQLFAAKHEIAILAQTYNLLVHQYLGLLKQRAQSGCSLKILMMAARDENGSVNPNVESYEIRWSQKGLLPMLENNSKIFSRWLSSLDNETRKQVEIRTYLEFPFGNYFFLDFTTVHF